MDMFLSIDEGLTPSIWWTHDGKIGVVALDKFFEDSKPDMSKEMARMYADKFHAFAEELREHAET